MRRRELFPVDRGLQARMVAAAVLTPALVVAALVACALMLPLRAVAGLAIVVGIGVQIALRERRPAARGRILAPGERPELQAIVERLCVIADLPRPEIALEAEAQPNSWIVDVPGRPPRLHVTTGLLALLDGHELEAVVAHELSHVGNRDATVMTVVGLPGAALLAGSRRSAMGFWPLMAASVVGALIGRVSAVGTSALSRYRELTADAGAARMTGRPAALGSALLKVSGELGRAPLEDARAAAARNAFNLLPAGEPGSRLLRTHPSLERRLQALERLEHRLQHARLPSA